MRRPVGYTNDPAVHDVGGAESPATVETMWPYPVAVGATVVFENRPHRVLRSTPRRVACDDSAIFGAHLEGAEGALGALVGLVPIAARPG